MKRIGTTLSILVLAGSLAGSAIAAESKPYTPKGVKPGVISAMATNYAGTACHLKFPAIRPSTFGSPKPQLRPATSMDVIDYYGPCDHDPLGKDEVESQKRVHEERQNEQ